MASRKKAPKDEEFLDDRMMALIALTLHESAARFQEVSGQSIEAGPCPAQEELAAFSDGLLDKDRLAAIIAHLDLCEKCYREMLEVFSVQERLQPEKSEEEPS